MVIIVGLIEFCSSRVIIISYWMRYPVINGSLPKFRILCNSDTTVNSDRSFQERHVHMIRVGVAMLVDDWRQLGVYVYTSWMLYLGIHVLW